ncbi:MAG: class I SAM-dependent methyltransferase [Flavisolibacter sp.]|nr:class I SAM-dependent methyltransferase [Flavisolibacter sp.]
MNDKLFSVQASEYAQYRPVYPTGLFEFIAGLCSEHEMAWDSGTGNGQAARYLADYFQKVYATDISLSQIEQAFRHPKVEYKVEAAEECSLPPNSVDAVTAATAVHWFDEVRYYHQVNRVLKPGGILAIWSYADCEITPEVDEVVKHYHQIIRQYWDERINKNLEHYVSQPFPYPLIEAPDFFIEKDYTLEDFMQYLFTWSSTQTYIKKHNKNPLDLIRTDLRNAWKGADERKAVWKLFMKVGHKPLA